MTDRVSQNDPYGARSVYSVFDTRNEKEISKDVKRMRALTNCAVGARAAGFN